MTAEGPWVTKTGKVLTDADIEALADEAEQGYDVSHLKGKPSRSSYLFASPLVMARMLKRQYPNMDHLWEAIECPYCHAPPGEPCKTKKGRSADMSHMARIDGFKYGQPSG